MNRQYSVRRLPIANPIPPKCIETVSFGLGEKIGVPVRLTAEGMWTVNDGHRLLFDEEREKSDPSIRDVTLQLTVSSKRFMSP